MAFQDRNPFDQFDSAAPSGLPQGAQVLIPESPTVRAKDQVDLQAVQNNIANSQQRLGLDRAAEARAQAKAEREAREWAATHNPDGSPKPVANRSGSAELTAATRANAINAFTATRQLDNLIRDIEQRYQSGPGSTRGVAGAADWLPTPTNRGFNDAANAVRGAAITALGFTSGQTNTPREVEQNIGPYIPSAGDYDENILGKIARLKELRDRARVQAVTVLGGVPSADGRITPVTQLSPQERGQLFPAGTMQPTVPGDTGSAFIPGANPPSGPNGGGGSNPPSPGGAPPGTTLAFNDEARPVTGARLAPEQEAAVIAAIRTGDRGQALSLLQRFSGNAPDAATLQGVEAAIGAVRQNPNAQIGLNYGGVDAAAQEAEDRKRFGNQLAPALAERANAGGVDTSIRAGVNGLTGGLADYAAAAAGTLGGGSFNENLQRQQALTEADTRLRPGNTMISNIIGGTGGALAAELGAARLLSPLGAARTAAWAPRLGDAAYGGVSGATSALPGESGQGALTGGGAGLFGGMVGRGVVRGAASGLRGVRDASVVELRSRGIPLTVGQTVGNSGFLGRTIKGAEDAFTSLPGVGNMVDARRTEGLAAFNRAAFQDAAPPGAQITATGAQGMGQIRKSVGDAYNRALNPVTIDANDPAFVGDIGATINAARGIPNVGNAQDAALAALQSRVSGAVDPVNETISGRGFQEAYRGLARTGRERANGDYGHEVGQVMRQGQGALAGALERQNPGAFGGFLEANAANRRANVLAGALKNAGNQADELITPAQLNRADITSTSRLEGQINSAAGNRPFYDLATAGQQVLPSRLPDSGTAKRAIVGALTTGTLGGAGYAAGGNEGASAGTGGGLALSGLLALGGTKAGQKQLTKMLASRPDIFISAGEQLNRRARIGGIFGAPMLAGYSQ